MNEQKSISKNFVLNLIRTCMSLLFPVITFSYASRILGTVGIGKVNFSTAIVSYYTLCASLGISNYGIREGARIRDDKEKFSKLVQELFFINLVTTILSYSVFIVMVLFVPAVKGYEKVLMISGLSIGLTALGLEWLYTAVEDYQYITIRQLVMQGVSLVLMFVLVRDQNDYLAYSFILVFSSVGANVFNFIHARKYILFQRFHNYNIKKHLRPIFVLFTYTLSINLYNNLDSVMLGMQIGDEAVGVYSAAVKMNRMVVTMLATLGVVLIPRLSYYLEKKAMDQYRELLKKSLHFVLMLSIPAIVGMWVLADEIIFLFSGSEFSASVLTLKILTPIIFVIPISTWVNSQILIPNKKESYVVIATLIGAMINFTLNYILIPHYGANGAAFASVIGEFVVMCTALFLVRKMYQMEGFFRGGWKYVVAAIPIVLVSEIVHRIIKSDVIVIILTVVFGTLTYFLILLCFGNAYVKQILHSLRSKCKL